MGWEPTGLVPGGIFADDYRIVRLLAEGGMGAIYVADQISTGRPRALKLMKPELAGDPLLRRRFEQEARIGARIESDHLVEIHAASVDPSTGVPFLVMDLLHGEDLGARLDREGALPLAEVRSLMGEIGDAVGAAHDAGIVHRDLKPENVFLSHKRRPIDGFEVRVKVLDFGIAKLLAEAHARTHATAPMLGTPAWMAPEQMDGGEIGPPADVWALGLILYRCVTGRYYWRSCSGDCGTLPQILKEVVMGPLPAGTQRAREQGALDFWPLALDGVLARCLARDPLKRYRNAKLMMAGLGEVLDGLEVVPMPLAPSVPSVSIRARSSLGHDMGGASTDDTIPAKPVEPSVDRNGPVVLPSDLRAGGPYRAPGAPATALQVLPIPPHGAGSALLHSPLGRSLPVDGIRIALALAMGALFVGGFTLATRHRDEAAKHAALAGDHVATAHERALSEDPGPACRVCTGAVHAEGGLSRSTVISSVAAVYPRMESECLGLAGGRSTRSVSIAFDVSGGVVQDTRSVTSVPKGDGLYPCIVRALGDAAFPGAARTAVQYTFRFDTRR